MIKNWLITGDTHGRVRERLNQIKDYKPSDTAMIILGDAGLNFYRNGTDKKEKLRVEDTGYIIYCVRGNHEERPENIPSMRKIYDEDVQGTIYYQPAFPHIKYFIDGQEYLIGSYRTLVLGGAYSVDKYYRLIGKENCSWTGWFKDEQLTAQEMNKISQECYGKRYDLVLSHTCPFSWQPTELFLAQVDQSTVDNSMEKWLEEFKDSIEYGLWLFGHFHEDMLIRPKVEMFFTNIENIDDIAARWYPVPNPPYWMRKSQQYYYD